MDNNRIIDIDDFYNRCEREKITPFAATSSLDNKDVILLTDDIEELFRFLYKGIIINHNKNRANLH